MPRRAIPFTADAVQRALRGAMAAGCAPKGCDIAPDGTIRLRFDEDEAASDADAFDSWEAGGVSREV